MIRYFQIKDLNNMKIAGLQKLSLLDYPEKICCTVFTSGCNFRCPFCHNSSLVLDLDEATYMTEDDFFSYIEKRRNLLDGVCVSGGEPLIHAGIEQFLRKIKDLGYLVKLDTNGSFPERLKELVNKRLCDYVAMDIKSSRSGYLKAIGLSSFEYLKIEKSIKFLMENTVAYEFRTTAVKELHSNNDFISISEQIKGASRYVIQNFVNSDDVIDKSLSAFSQQELEEFASHFHGKVGEVIIK